MNGQQNSSAHGFPRDPTKSVSPNIGVVDLLQGIKANQPPAQQVRDAPTYTPFSHSVC
jgi:hypothetical protein